MQNIVTATPLLTSSNTSLQNTQSPYSIKSKLNGLINGDHLIGNNDPPTPSAFCVPENTDFPLQNVDFDKKTIPINVPSLTNEGKNISNVYLNNNIDKDYDDATGDGNYQLSSSLNSSKLSNSFSSYTSSISTDSKPIEAKNKINNDKYSIRDITMDLYSKHAPASKIFF